MLNSKYIKLLQAAILFASLVLALSASYKIGSSNAAKIQQEDRVLENLIPKHVPLGIKIRKEKEKEFKDLNNEKWAHDFELEVTNTGDKPIYEFYLSLVLDVKDSSGQDVLSSVDYGRAGLGDHTVRATTDDIPLKPGESCTLKIHPGQLGAWDIIRRKEGRPHPRRIRIIFVTLSFG